MSALDSGWAASVCEGLCEYRETALSPLSSCVDFLPFLPSHISALISHPGNTLHRLRVGKNEPLRWMEGKGSNTVVLCLSCLLSEGGLKSFFSAFIFLGDLPETKLALA